MYLTLFAIFSLAIVHPIFCNNRIGATDDEFLQSLLTNDVSAPPHELVNIEYSEKLIERVASRKARHIHMRAFGENIDLWLNSKDTILASTDTPVYYSSYSESSPQKVKITRQSGLMDVLGEFLEDPDELATVVISTDDFGRLTYNGHIGAKGLSIRSLAPKAVNEYLRKRRSIINVNDDDLESMRHVVYKDNRDLEKNYFVNKTLDTSRLHERAAERRTPDIPDTLYPEILVVADYSLYKNQGHDIYRFLEYILAFWNGVDLKYRSVEGPKVRFHISAIIIATDEHATPYIQKNMETEEAFRPYHAMNDARYFFYGIKDKFPLSSWDAAVTMTRFELGNDSGIVGMGYSGACTYKLGDDNVMAVAIIQDNGAFFGTHVAAHELGHVLHLSHDSDEDNDCRSKSRFIMSSSVGYTKNSTAFSSCSLRQLQQELEGGNLQCLYNKPQMTGKKLPELLPGRITSLDEQCAILKMGPSCIPKENYGQVDICVDFYCRKRPEDEQNEEYEDEEYQENIEKCYSVGVAALEGTPCQDDNAILPGYCFQNDCKSLNFRSSSMRDHL